MWRGQIAGAKRPVTVMNGRARHSVPFIPVDKGRVQQSNFHDYRMMRINEAPEVEVHIMPSTEAPGGIGEPGVPPIIAAVANAVSIAKGKRVRRLPIEAA